LRMIHSPPYKYLIGLSLIATCPMIHRPRFGYRFE
jgi:hypothetical protein